MRNTLNREAGAMPALSRSRNAERSHDATGWIAGKARRAMKQSRKTCPTGNAESTCERQGGAPCGIVAPSCRVMQEGVFILASPGRDRTAPRIRGEAAMPYGDVDKIHCMIERRTIK